MSYVPPSQLEGASLIAQYVINCRNKGHFLPYDDHRLINKWLTHSEDADHLLLILSDFLPDFYAKAQHKTQPPALSRLDRKISLILSHQRLRDIQQPSDLPSSQNIDKLDSNP